MIKKIIFILLGLVFISFAEVKIINTRSNGLEIEFSLLASKGDELSFPGCGKDEKSGEYFHLGIVGIPSNASVSVKLKNVLWKDLQNVSSSRQFPKGGSCFVSKTGWIRSQRIAGIVFYPYKNIGGKIQYAKTATVKVTWNTSALKRLSNSVSSESVFFEKGLSKLILNYSQAKSYRYKRPVSKRLATDRITDKVKIDVSKTGMYRVSYEQLKKSGVDVDKINPKTFKLHNFGKEIPIWISGNSDNKFDRGESIVFYGTILHGKKTYYSRYTFTNVYWLSWGGALGLRYVTQSVATRYDMSLPEYLNKVSVAPPYVDTLHIEEDIKVRFLESDKNSDSSDVWYWESVGDKDLTTFSITIPPGLENKDLNASLIMNIYGLSKRDEKPDHELNIFINKNKITDVDGNSAVWNDKKNYTFTSGFFPNSYLANNKIDIVLEKTKEDVDVSALNWFKLIYYPKKIATNGVCKFKSGDNNTTGLLEFKVQSFGSNKISLWDLAGRRLVGGYIKKEKVTSGFYNYSITFHDSIDAPVTYYAIEEDKYLSPDTIKIYKRSEILSTGNSADIIILTHKEFKDSVADLVKLREEQGYKVAVVDVEDIYNEFNYGVMDLGAIKKFLKYAVNNWSKPSPWALLIIGDTSYDFDKQNRKKNFVPTYLSETYSQSLASDDDWFATVVGNDSFQDLMVGRLPVNNTKELRIVMDKIIYNDRHILKRSWRDRILLIGGFEKEFTRNNDYLSNVLIGSLYDQKRIDTESSSPYFCGRKSNRKLISTINSGVALLCFNGHGGGNVWSDGDIFNLDDVLKLNNKDKYPLTFSFTCFTGFFEKSYSESLGEKLVRALDRGSLTFYGASDHVDPKRDELLSREILSEIVSLKHKCVGEVIFEGEMKSILKYGDDILTTTREYNLIGDPLCLMNYPSDSLNVNYLFKKTNNTDSIYVSGKVNRINSGFVKVDICDSTYLMDSKTVSFSGDSFNVAFPIKSSAEISNGVVRAYVWNDDIDLRGVKHFSHNVLKIKNTYLSQSKIFPGDSAVIYAQMFKYVSDSTQSITCFYKVSSDMSDAGYREIQMEKVNDTLYKTSTKALINKNVKPNSRLWVKINLISKDKIIRSSPVSFLIEPLCDLIPDERSAFEVFGEDTIKCITRIKNIGGAKASMVKVRLILKENDSTADTIGTKSIEREIESGSKDSVVFVLPNIRGNVGLFMDVNPDTSIKESDMSNNSKELNMPFNLMVLKSSSDTIFSLDSNIYLFLDDKGKKAVSVLRADKGNFDVQKQGMAFCKLQDWDGIAYDVKMYGEDKSDYNICFNIDSSDMKNKISLLVSDTLVPKDYLGVYRWNEDYLRWVWQGGDLFNSTLKLKTNSSAKFCVGIKYDLNGPQIKVSSKGKPLLFTDYISIGYPVDIYIKDDAGLDVSTFEMFVNGEKPDSSRLTYAYGKGSSQIIVVNYLPKSKSGLDSMTIRIADVNGNYTEKKLAYMLGEKLEIKFLANYPNPFADKTVIAYTITDACSKASLEIFSIAGRLVKSWNLIDEFGQNNIGYYEVKWDGKDADGYNVANGTYYLKLKIEGERGKRKKIVPMAKLKGYNLK